MQNNITSVFHQQDIAIYIRCEPWHKKYAMNSPEYYQNILNRTTYNEVWLFLDPKCPKVLDKPNHPMHQTLFYMLHVLKGRVWQANPNYNVDSLEVDFVMLASAPRIIVPHGSTWAFWAALLSNASEIHVDASNHKFMGRGMKQYIYHNEETKSYYGHILANNEIAYRYKLLDK